MSKVPHSLTELLESSDPPEGFLNWFTEAEVRAALEAGRAGKHEPAVRAWLQAKERERHDLEVAATGAAQAYRRNRLAMWVAVAIAIVALLALLLPSVLSP